MIRADDRCISRRDDGRIAGITMRIVGIAMRIAGIAMLIVGAQQPQDQCHRNDDLAAAPRHR
jgi:hypothetical protein